MLADDEVGQQGDDEAGENGRQVERVVEPIEGDGVDYEKDQQGCHTIHYYRRQRCRALIFEWLSQGWVLRVCLVGCTVSYT